MTDANEHDRQDAPHGALLADLERLASRLDGQRFPGRAWPVRPAPVARRSRLVWRYVAVPVSTVAAMLLVSLMLWPRAAPTHPTDDRAVPAPSARVNAAPIEAADPWASLELPSSVDLAITARAAYTPPDVRLAVPSIPSVPAVPQAPSPRSYRWSIPNVSIPIL